MSTTATTRRTLNPIAIAALAAVAIVLPHVPSFFHRLLDGDEAIYASIAALMNMGEPLYAAGGDLLRRHDRSGQPAAARGQHRGADDAAAHSVSAAHAPATMAMVGGAAGGSRSVQAVRRHPGPAAAACARVSRAAGDARAGLALVCGRPRSRPGGQRPVAGADRVAAGILALDDRHPDAVRRHELDAGGRVVARARQRPSLLACDRCPVAGGDWVGRAMEATRACPPSRDGLAGRVGRRLAGRRPPVVALL